MTVIVIVMMRLFLGLLLLSGCGSPSSTGKPEAGTKNSEAGSLDTLSEAQLRGAMGQLTLSIQELNSVLALGDPFTEAQVEQTRNFMDRIVSISEAIDPASSTHPDLEQSWGSFLDLVTTARQEATAEPPNYARARTIADACVSCHGPR